MGVFVYGSVGGCIYERLYMHTHTLYIKRQIYLYIFYIYKHVYVCVCIYVEREIYACTHTYIYGDVPEDLLKFPTNASTAMEWWVSKTTLYNSY